MCFVHLQYYFKTVGNCELEPYSLNKEAKAQSFCPACEHVCVQSAETIQLTEIVYRTGPV